MTSMGSVFDLWLTTDTYHTRDCVSPQSLPAMIPIGRNLAGYKLPTRPTPVGRLSWVIIDSPILVVNINDYQLESNSAIIALSYLLLSQVSV